MIAGWAFFADAADGATGNREFTNTDAYTLAGRLEKLHPDNRSLRTATSDKIRQQLQVLRDAGLLLHVERGCWLRWL